MGNPRRVKRVPITHAALSVRPRRFERFNASLTDDVRTPEPDVYGGADAGGAMHMSVGGNAANAALIPVVSMPSEATTGSAEASAVFSS